MRKLNSVYHNMSLYKKLMILCIIIVFPVFFGTILFTEYAIDKTRDQQYNRIKKEFDYNVEDLENEFGRIYRMLLDVRSNTDHIRTMANSYPDHISKYKLGKLITDLQSQLSRSSLTSDMITDITVGWIELSRSSALSGRYKTEFDDATLDFYNRAKNSAGRNLIEGPYGSLQIYTLENTRFDKTPRYIIHAKLDKNRIVKKLMLVDDRSFSVVFTPNWILAGDSDTIYYKDENTEENGIESEDSNSLISEKMMQLSETARDKIISSELHSGYLEMENYICIYTTSDLWGTTYCSFFVKNEIETDIHVYQIMIYAMCLITLIMLFIARTALYHSINIPLVKLMELFEKISLGEPVNSDNIEMKGELRDVYKRFLDMYIRLRDTQINAMEQRVALEKAEFHLLQAQINPHFLRNCFNITHICLRNGDYHTAQLMTSHLSKYFDYLSKSPKADAILKNEWEYVTAYLDIQKIRFGHKLIVEVEPLPEEYRFITIPKLSIQSVVENAFQHSTNLETDVRIIRISFQKEASFCVIIVWDNGDSVTEEKLAELTNSLHSNCIPSEHVGLMNINHRLKLMREDGGLVLKRSKYGGFEVHIRIPIN